MSAIETAHHERSIVSAVLPREDARRLAELAKAADRSVSAELRRAVRSYLTTQREEPPK